MFDNQIRQCVDWRRTFARVATSTCIAAYPLIGFCGPQSQCEALDDREITISCTLPADIPGGAPSASPAEAAKFAWQEFIALNWPALARNNNSEPRDKPDPGQPFGKAGYTDPLVWHTYRGKVEIYPGTGMPAGYDEGKPRDYGYDVRPVYTYAVPVRPLALVSRPSASPESRPWINLDENSQIGLDQIYAGKITDLDTQILYMAKANRKEYTYVASNNFFGGEKDKHVRLIFEATAKYVDQHKDDPLQGSANLISFPNGTIEVKAAWRKLTQRETQSGRFYTTNVRYYVKGPDNAARYVDSEFGLVGLHIIQKTATAPYFIYATFEQADNITDFKEKPLEDVNGNYLGGDRAPLWPIILSKNATPTTTQQFSHEGDFGFPAGQLYYQNTPNTGLVSNGKIIVNKRINKIPPYIIDINQRAHDAMTAYADKHGINRPVWMYYKLVNVQNAPINKPKAGYDYDADNASTYYQSNSVIETDYNLQKFSGRFTNFPKNEFTITDFTDCKFKPGASNLDKCAKEFDNVAFDGDRVNMGGCMGCHGNAQVSAGSEFSFILLHGRVPMPDLAGQPVTLEQVNRFAQYFNK
ncbi:hypothetical protein [Burkholderia pyrrocinia]|uniref:hypothetical protein n=1 Tax=Burkholderia pyrrocinia TaxID=60550 RepID=UPI001BCE353A|nr:hypothetical protein [Burkholderia pyrrocinia]QVN21450.1 hypothetical protein JYG32_18765 [Burkholderia pyrrocinia]